MTCFDEFEVCDGETKHGRFISIATSTGVELHSEVDKQCPRLVVIKRFKEIMEILKSSGVSRVTTYCPSETMNVRVACACVGFKNLGSFEGTTFYERIL